MAKRYLWVVEWWGLGGWEPTLGVTMTKAESVGRLATYRASSPTQRFRVVRYSAEDK